MPLTEQEKILRQRGYCKTYYQKNKERIKQKKQGNSAWLALEEAEKEWKTSLTMLCYKDKTFCGSAVKNHTCGRELTDDERKNAMTLDLPVAFGAFCDDKS